MKLQSKFNKTYLHIPALRCCVCSGPGRHTHSLSSFIVGPQEVYRLPHQGRATCGVLIQHEESGPPSKLRKLTPGCDKRTHDLLFKSPLTSILCNRLELKCSKHDFDLNLSTTHEQLPAINLVN